MFRKSIGFVLVVVVGLFLSGCGGETRHVEESPADETTENVAEKSAEKPAKPDVEYISKEDPNAVYTMDDVDMVGSYRRVDFRGLSPDQWREKSRIAVEGLARSLPPLPAELQSEAFIATGVRT